MLPTVRKCHQTSSAIPIENTNTTTSLSSCSQPVVGQGLERHGGGTHTCWAGCAISPLPGFRQHTKLSKETFLIAIRLQFWTLWAWQKTSYIVHNCRPNNIAHVGQLRLMCGKVTIALTRTFTQKTAAPLSCGVHAQEIQTKRTKDTPKRCSPHNLEHCHMLRSSLHLPALTDKFLAQENLKHADTHKHVPKHSSYRIIFINSQTARCCWRP